MSRKSPCGMAGRPLDGTPRIVLAGRKSSKARWAGWNEFEKSNCELKIQIQYACSLEFVLINKFPYTSSMDFLLIGSHEFKLPQEK